ncbi:MAG: V-type ATP synthase subunit D [Gammaproteobacteria bacterium]|nr:V-type ATP synthase subunit D [Gammaproteobacteria bacterium]
MSGPGQAPTRAAVVELKDERVVVNEAYNFLDEKRLLLAAEIIRQIDNYEKVIKAIKKLNIEAHKALENAVQRHGLEGLTTYPPANIEDIEFISSAMNFMGVSLMTTELDLSELEQEVSSKAENPSSEAVICRRVFSDLLKQSAILSGISGNLQRLSVEYRLTERRSKALENVILPQIEHDLKTMEDLLEEMDLEDLIRARSQLDKD